jgi:DNA polymerase-3 subunit gamma/tau
MKEICDEMKARITDDALALLATNADGSVRDGLSLLEQCVSTDGKEVTRELVLEILGSPGDEAIAALTAAVAGGDTAGALVLLDEILKEGKDERRIMEEWIDWFRSALLIKFVKAPERILNRSIENINAIKEQSGTLEVTFINDSIYRISKLFNESRWSAHTRILLEMAVIEMSRMKSAKTQEQ